MSQRQIVLDTETTGLDPDAGHRIIEVGCLELAGRRFTGNDFHVYINPEREVEEGAMQVHGITNEFLAQKQVFSEIAGDLQEYLRDAELVIHNAPFDVGFLNAEFGRLGKADFIENHCSVLDTLQMARDMHPGQRNSLDALCKRYEVDDSRRELHGALLDAQLLAEVYLAMTGGQTRMSLGDEQAEDLEGGGEVAAILAKYGKRPVVVAASQEERALHESRLEAIQQASDGACVWLNVGSVE